MHLYSATVKLKRPGDTSWTHELPKDFLTPAEVMILQNIHGSDAITNVKPNGEKNIVHSREVERLRFIYNRPDRDYVTQLFGAVPKLPQELEIAAAAEDEDTRAPVDIEDVIAEEPPKQTLGLPGKK
jgi:hypothetical protein